MRVSSRTFLPAVALVALVAVLAGCTKSDSGADASSNASPLSGAAASSAGARSPARDVTITTTDSAVTLSLAGDTIAMGLSQKVLAEARRDMAKDSATGDSAGFGANIERMVKSTVSSALGTRIAYPLEDIDDVRYENGTIEFDYRHRNRVLAFENVKADKRSALSDFAPADAQRFVAAVRAAKGKR